MFTLFWMFEIVMLGAVTAREPSELSVNASSYPFNPTSCEEFGQGARISPHDVVDSLWRIFYFWAEGMEISTILFALPSVKKVDAFKKIVEATVPSVNVEWKNATLFMEPRLGIRVLFVSSGHNGSFLAIVKNEHVDEVPHKACTVVHSSPIDIRWYISMPCNLTGIISMEGQWPFKPEHSSAYTLLLGGRISDRSLKKPQIHLTTVRMKTADRFLGIVNCIDHTAFALARVSEMPQTKTECITAAAGLGLDTQKGKSYLSTEKYQIFDEL